MEDILVERDELRKTAESFNGFMPVDKNKVIALLDALDLAEKENTRLRKALGASEAELQTTCYCCKLFKDCHLPCRLNNVREANKAALKKGSE